MKKYRILIYALLACVILYLGGSFVAASLNVTKWSVVLRGFIGFIITCIAIIGVVIQAMKEEDNHT